MHFLYAVDMLCMFLDRCMLCVVTHVACITEAEMAWQAAEAKVPFASSISSSDSNGDRGDSDPTLSDGAREKLKQEFLKKQEEQKEKRRQKRERWAKRRSARRARKQNKQPSGKCLDLTSVGHRFKCLMTGECVTLNID